MVEQDFIGVRPRGLARSQPDNTLPIAGEDGAPMLQDGSRMVTRGAVTRDNGDFDLSTVDVVDEPVEIPLEDVGGASIVNIDLVSLGDPGEEEYDDDPAANPTDASRPFNVTIETLAADGETVLTSRTPEAADGVEEVRAGLGVFSDNERIRIEHDGLGVSENLISGTINVQSGATDAVQIRGVDGTIQDPDNSEELELLADTLGDLAEALADARTEYEEETSINRSLQSAPYPIISLDTRSASLVDLALNATAADASYEIQTRGGAGEEWFDWITYDGDDGTGTDRIRDTLRTGSRFIRLVVTEESTVEDATATVTLQASG